MKIRKNEIEIDIAKPLSISQTLDYLLDSFDHICDLAESNGGIQYGTNENGIFKALESEIHPKIPSYSELSFFIKATENKDNLDQIQTYLQKVIKKNESKVLWFDDEMLMGLNAAFALAFNDSTYISDFVDLLRSCDMNHEVYQTYFIEILLSKWGICKETVSLLAARSGSISGQYGIEAYNIPELMDEQKALFVENLFKDALKSKAVFPDLLIDALEFLEISIDSNKFKAFFNQHKPTFKESDSPGFSDIC